MKERVGFIGIGQAGGNIVSLFAKEGYTCLAINTSKEDLKVTDVDKKLLLPNAEGCHHDREKSKAYIKNFYKDIVDITKETFKDTDLIYTVFSSGGGTGSGAGPILTEILSNMYPGKIFGSICILPTETEPLRVQINAYKCLVELSNIENIGGVLVVDNATREDFLEINKELLHLFDSLLTLTSHVSVKSNIDKSEIYEFLKTRGCIEINRIVPGNQVDSIFPSRENDGKVVFGLISVGKNETLDNLKKFTEGVYDLFINYNDTDESLIAFCGLSFYQTRLNSIKEMIDMKKVHVLSNIQNSKVTKIKDDLEWRISSENKKEPQLNEETLKCIFDRY